MDNMRMHFSYNCTNMELKRGVVASLDSVCATYNCTNMELKLGTVSGNGKGFNAL